MKWEQLNMKQKKWNKLEKLKEHPIVKLFLNMAAN